MAIHCCPLACKFVGQDVMSQIEIYLYSPIAVLTKQMFQQGLLSDQRNDGRVSPLLPQERSNRVVLGYFLRVAIEQPVLHADPITDDPIWMNQWFLTEKKIQATQQLLQEQLDGGHIVPFNSYSFLIKKKYGKW